MAGLSMQEVTMTGLVGARQNLVLQAPEHG